jgi:hypothetical protein
MEVYANVCTAQQEIGDYLCYYPITKRRHSSLNYRDPKDHRFPLPFSPLVSRGRGESERARSGRG